MRENIGLIIIIIIAIISIALFSHFKSNNDDISYINFEKIDERLKDVDLAVVYFGELTKEKEQDLKDITKGTNIKLYTSEANIDDVNTILVTNLMTADTNDVYILFINADPVGYVVGTATKKVLKETINELFFYEIPSSKIAYVTPNSSDFIKKVKSKKYTVAVYAMDDCIHCNKFLPIINKIAADYGIEINYFNEDKYDSEEYKKIMALDLEIPARCTVDRKDTTMLRGFPKPMTIITKNGKFVDCIKGNVKEDVVLDMLEKYGIIKRD